MNEKEAREIIPRYKQLFDRRAEIEMEPVYRMAQGYLEAIEKAKAILIPALKTTGCDCPRVDPVTKHGMLCSGILAKKALAQWEKEK